MAHTGVSRADTVTAGWINPMIRQRRVDRKSSVTSMAAANRSGALCSGSAAVQDGVHILLRRGDGLEAVGVHQRLHHGL